MDLVRLSGDRVVVTSLDICNHFGKQHKDVLRAIDGLDCSDAFRQRNFAPTVYHRQNPSGGQPIEARMFEITRDGFVFLCMGFTGQRAALWKERYIEAFNKMEAALKAPVVAQPDPAVLSLAAQIGELRDEMRLQTEAMLDLYRDLDGARKGHIRALSKLAAERRATAAAASRSLMLKMLAENRPRAEIAAATGRTLNYIRQVAFRARADGSLPPLPPSSTGDLFGGAA